MTSISWVQFLCIRNIHSLIPH